MPDVPGSDPIPPGRFVFDGGTFAFDPAAFNAQLPLILLPDGRLLRAGAFEDGVPLHLAVAQPLLARARAERA